MNIRGTDPKPCISLAKPINIDISNDINRRPGSGVPENPLKIGLDRHVRRLVAVENPGSDGPSAALGNPLIPGHTSLNEGGKNIDHQWGV